MLFGFAAKYWSTGVFCRCGDVCRCICGEHSNVVASVCRRGEEVRPIRWTIDIITATQLTSIFAWSSINGKKMCKTSLNRKVDVPHLIYVKFTFRSTKQSLLSAILVSTRKSQFGILFEVLAQSEAVWGRHCWESCDCVDLKKSCLLALVFVAICSLIIGVMQRWPQDCRDPMAWMNNS